jgi:hypothetical protein
MRRNIAVRRKGSANAPPPPYEAALYRRLWAVVAPYVDPDDLYSVCLTCRQLHQAFIPYLWLSPATRFGTDNDTVYCESEHSYFVYLLFGLKNVICRLSPVGKVAH